MPDPELQEQESKFNLMELSEQQVYQNLQELQKENERSIETHLQVKKEAYKLQQMLVDSLVKPACGNQNNA